MKTSHRIFALTLMAASLAVAGSALAHGGMGMGPGMGSGMEMGMGPGMGQGMMGMGRMHGPESSAAVSARLAESKAALKITSAQEPAWGKYAALVTQQAEVRTAMRTQMQAQMSDPKTAATVDFNAQRETMQKFQQENLAARTAAMKELLGVLTPEQKAVADQRLPFRTGHRMAGHGPIQ